MTNNPFEALSALRDILPEGDDATPTEAPGSEPLPTLRLFYEVKGRGGKPVTIISGLESMATDRVNSLASLIKKKLAVGGSCRGGEILVQGDRRVQLRSILADQGFKVKG